MRSWTRHGNGLPPGERIYVSDPGEDAADRWNESQGGY